MSVGFFSWFCAAGCAFFWTAAAYNTEPILRLLEPTLSYRLDVEESDIDVEDWRKVAIAAAQLVPIECPTDMLGAIDQMLREAEKGDAIAMAGLGAMFALGRECEPGSQPSWKPTQNITWGLYWLTQASEGGQVDAKALLAFFHLTDVLYDIYGFRDFRSDRAKGRLLLQQAADGGSYFAAMTMAYRYSYGVGVVANKEAGVEWYEEAAKLSLASLERDRNRSVEQSFPNEIEHFTLLTHLKERVPFDAEYTEYIAKTGDVPSLVYAGQMYHGGLHGVPHDRKKAYEMFLKASRMGDGQGHAYVGLMLLQDGKYAEAVKYFRRAIKLNDASGWIGLAYAYLYGAGVPQNDELGAKCMAKAARRGHLDAIYNLGILAFQGRGMIQSVETGLRLIRTAAEFSHTRAQFQYSQLIAHGLLGYKDLDVSSLFFKYATENGKVIHSLLTTALRAYDAKDLKRSLLYYALAAHAGNEVGQHNAAYLYANSKPPLHTQGILMGKQRAMHYFSLAGLQDSHTSAESEIQAGVLYEEKRDYASAYRLYRSAANVGNTDAMWHLGYMYWHGHGVTKDVSTAMALFQAGQMGSQYAKLHGLEKLTFGAMRNAFKHRASLTLGALFVVMRANGVNPLDLISQILQSRRKPIAGMLSEDDVDLFDDENF